MKVSNSPTEQGNSRLGLSAKSPMKSHYPSRLILHQQKTNLKAKLTGKNKSAHNIGREQVRMGRPFSHLPRIPSEPYPRVTGLLFGGRVLEELETDKVILDRRSKELQIGKNSASYSFYREKIDKENRDQHMPRTPDKYTKFPRRRWDGSVKAWKVQVHRIAEKLSEEEVKVEVGIKKEIKEEAGIKEEIKKENEIKKEIKEEKDFEIKKEVGWRDHDAGYPWRDEIVQQERENDELSRIRASSWTSSDQGIGMDYSGTGTPRTLSGSTSPTTFLIPAFEEEQLSKASSKLRNFSKSATS